MPTISPVEPLPGEANGHHRRAHPARRAPPADARRIADLGAAQRRRRKPARRRGRQSAAPRRPQKAARLIGWLRRLKPAAGWQALKLAWVGINAVAVDQRTTLEGRVLGVSTSADQLFQLPAGSVDADSLQVRSRSPAAGYQPPGRGWTIWPRSRLTRGGARGGGVRLDAEAGTLRFGDGMRGHACRSGRMRASASPMGASAAGVPATCRRRASRSLVGPAGRAARPAGDQVAQPLATEGGEDAETLARAEQRIPSTLRHREQRSHRRRLPPAVARGARHRCRPVEA